MIDAEDLKIKVKTKEGLRNYQKVIKSSFRDAACYFGFINYNPASDLRISKMNNFNLKKRKYKAYIFSRRNRLYFNKI